MSINRFLDNVIALRILRTFVMPWTSMAAFKAGVIDSTGNILLKPSQQTSAQVSSYSKLDVLIWRLRKLIEKLPLGKRTISKLILALALIKEEDGTEFDDVMPELLECLEEQAMLAGEDSWLMEDMGTGGTTSNVTGGIDGTDAGLAKRQKITSVVQHKPDDEYAGASVFDVNDEHMMKSRFGKRKFLKYSTYVGKDETGEKIRSYSRSNPKKNIIIRHAGSMIYMRKHP